MKEKTWTQLVVNNIFHVSIAFLIEGSNTTSHTQKNLKQYSSMAKQNMCHFLPDRKYNLKDHNTHRI